MSDDGGIIYKLDGPLSIAATQKDIKEAPMAVARGAIDRTDRARARSGGITWTISPPKRGKVPGELPSTSTFLQAGELPSRSTFTGGRRLPPSKKTMKRKNKPKPRTYKK